MAGTYNLGVSERYGVNFRQGSNIFNYKPVTGLVVVKETLLSGRTNLIGIEPGDMELNDNGEVMVPGRDTGCTLISMPTSSGDRLRP